MSDKYVPINAHCDIQSGFAFPSTSFVEGGVPIVRMSDLKGGKLRFENTKYVSEVWLKSSAPFILKSGDFLQGMSGSLSNYAVVTKDDEPALLNQRVGRLKQKDKNVEYEYICYWLKSSSYSRYADIQGEGAAQKNISSKQIGKFQYRDAILNEQKKIVLILNSIESTIEKTEALVQKYQKIKTGLMHDLFTRGVTENGKLRPPREQAPELYKETSIGWIPKEWNIRTTMELAEPNKGSTVIGPFGSDLVVSDYRLEGVPVVFVRDLKEDGFCWISDIYVTFRKAQKLYAHRVKAGDILATKMGLPPCVACEYPVGMSNGIITADIIRLTPNRRIVSTSWLKNALNQERTKRQVAAITSGVTRPKVTLSDFKKIKMATPKIEEQIQITQRIEQQQELINLESSNVVKIHKQKKGLMHDLLTGKVKVKIDQEEAHV